MIQSKFVFHIRFFQPLLIMKNIDSITLKKWLENGEAILVDVREPSENQANKINGSHLLPLGQVSCDFLPEYEGKKLVIHCHSGKRSQSACAKLLSQNPNLEIYNLEGGIVAWNSSGNETAKSRKFFLPLNQQVQLTIGLFVLTGSLLGFFATPTFFFIPAFFGAGLCFAGLSGWCGLATLLAKMPWNKTRPKSTSCTF